MNAIASHIDTQILTPKKPIDYRDPIGLDSKTVAVRDLVTATLGKDTKVQIEILSTVHMIPWMFHVLVTPDGQREGEQGASFAAILDEPIAKLFKGQQEYSVSIISNLLS